MNQLFAVSVFFKKEKNNHNNIILSALTISNFIRNFRFSQNVHWAGLRPESMALSVRLERHLLKADGLVKKEKSQWETMLTLPENINSLRSACSFEMNSELTCCRWFSCHMLPWPSATALRPSLPVPGAHDKHSLPMMLNERQKKSHLEKP